MTNRKNVATAADRVNADGTRQPDGRSACRIGVAYPGDVLDPATWSGSPSGIVRGLRELGFEPVAIRARPRPPFDALALNLATLGHLRPRMFGSAREGVWRARQAAYVGPPFALTLSWAARRSVAAAGPLDGVIQIGAGYDVPHARVATFEDITIIQALRYPYPSWANLSSGGRRRRITSQREVYRRVAACCLTTGWAAESVVRDYGIPLQKVHTVGVGRNHDPAVHDRDWSRPRFLFIGKDWEGKNGAGLLRAFAQVRMSVPDARLELVGNHPRIDVPGVTGHGYLSLADPDGRRRVDELLRVATCFVLPSHFEASAIAYVEAAAAGLPSIGSSAGGSADLIGAGGLVVDPSDTEAIAQAMIRLSRADEAERIGAIARVRADLFTWRAVAGRLVRSLQIPGVSDEGLAEYLA